MQNGVTFWTEGGQSIGMGHVMRCINIARAFGAEEMPLHFLVNNERPVIERLNQEAFFHVVYPMSGKHANRLTKGVVVIDTKRDVSSQVRSLKEDGKKVVLIDNSSTDEADAIVMPTPVYRGQSRPALFSGSSYLIIGDNFREARGEGPISHSAPLKVLVTMGGADPFNLTEMVLKALWPIEGIEVTTVIGPAFRMTDTMEEFVKRSGESFTFAFNVKDMAPLMRASHIAFTAVGTTVYELAYMGVPSVLDAFIPWPLLFTRLLQGARPYGDLQRGRKLQGRRGSLGRNGAKGEGSYRRLRRVQNSLSHKFFY